MSGIFLPKCKSALLRSSRTNYNQNDEEIEDPNQSNEAFKKKTNTISFENNF